MSLIETIAHDALWLANAYYHAKTFTTLGTEGTPEEVQQQMHDRNNAAMMSTVALTLENYFGGRITRNQAVADGVNALIDDKVVNYMEDNGHSPLVSKAVGFVASGLGGMLIKGIADSLFGRDDTLGQAEDTLRANGRIRQPDQNTFDKFTEVFEGHGPASHGLGSLGQMLQKIQQVMDTI